MSWLPLKNAPKDGSWVLAVFECPGESKWGSTPGVSVFLQWCKESERWEDHDGDEWNPGDAVYTVVPAPPKKAAGE